MKQQISVAKEKKPIEGEDTVKDLICYCFEYSVDDINQDYSKMANQLYWEKSKWQRSLEIASVRLKILSEYDA